MNSLAAQNQSWRLIQRALPVGARRSRRFGVRALPFLGSRGSGGESAHSSRPETRADLLRLPPEQWIHGANPRPTLAASHEPALRSGVS
ncbi:MAG: hypothetical protein AAB676_03800, partial [Verrucomicrobiota bacterium]